MTARTWVLAGALILAPLAAGAQAPVRDTAFATATVTFVSGAEIYVGAGRLDGLVEGAELSVVRGGAVVATLRVKFLASHRAACELVQGVGDVAAGDAVRFRPRAADSAVAAGPVAAAASRPRRMGGPGLHGRIGTRYLHAGTSTESGGQEVGSTSFTQPSLDVRLNGRELGGTRLGLALDLRARRTSTNSAGRSEVDGHTRAYQAALLWNAPGAPFRAVAGRQYLSAIGSVGLLDGVLAEVNGQRLTAGGFAGFEPDLATLGFSGDVHDFGAYTQLHSRPGAATAASVTLGAVGSYEGGEARREWGVLQGSVTNSYLSLLLLQELDYYRPWKREGPNAEASAFSTTSRFASASVRPAPWLSLRGTYDKRRSVPLLRDFTNPETEFDDTYREGYGAGFHLSGRRVYGGTDWRKSTGGSAGGANSWTTTLGVNRLTRLNLGLSARATWYANDNDSTGTNPGAGRTTGRLLSGRVSFDPAAPLHLDLNAGIRREDNPNALVPQESSWYGLDADLSLGRAWFLSLSALRQQDPANPGTSTLTQFYGGVSWRF
jgi:hypothetical protein